MLTILVAYSICRITNAVKESGGLKEKLFHTAYNAKRQAILKGKNSMQFIEVRFLFFFWITVMRISFASIVKHRIDTANQSYMDNWTLAEFSKINGKAISWIERRSPGQLGLFSFFIAQKL